METNEDWIREIVNRRLGFSRGHPRLDPLVDELAAEVTIRLAEAYEEGWNAKRKLNRQYPT